MSLIEVISVVTLKRTDTTLDLSQKAKRFGVLKQEQKEKYTLKQQEKWQQGFFANGHRSRLYIQNVSVGVLPPAALRRFSGRPR